ncbi:MAG: GAP family protein [Propionibacteriaceae bacterium]
MLSALGQLLPLAVALAVSSVPITVTILMLLSPRRNQVAVPFLIGWVAGMAAVVVVAALGARALPIRPVRAAQTSIGIAEIVVGIAVLVFAGFTWHRAARATEQTDSRWLKAVEQMGPLAALGLAIALNLRPKGLLLGAAAGLAIAGAGLRGADAVIVTAIYLALACSTVLVPVIVTLLSPARMQPRLVLTRDWLNRNGNHITVVVLLMVGFVILGAGLSRL